MTHEPLSISCIVRRIIAKHLDLDPADVTEDKTLYALGVSDLEALEIGLDIEEAFDGEAPDEEHEACRTVGDYVNLGRRLAGEAVS